MGLCVVFVLITFDHHQNFIKRVHIIGVSSCVHVFDRDNCHNHKDKVVYY